MCTALSWNADQTYFGRNLDLDVSYDEKVVIVPRNVELQMRHVSSMTSHYAMIGMASVVKGMPLYYDAVNEKGLFMAGLNFPLYTQYKDLIEGKDNIASFELIQWVLGQCGSLDEAKTWLSNVHLVKTCFSDDMPASPLHWIVCDSTGSIVIECMKEGLKIQDNPWCVLTNNPPFDYHLQNMHQYMSLSERCAVNTLNSSVHLENISLGFGAIGLPGDYSSASRFVKAAYVKSKSVVSDNEKDNINQFFKILNSVSMPNGCVLCSNGKYEYTRYSCCCTELGKYFYTTYENPEVNCVELSSIDLNSKRITVHELVK